MHNLENWWSDAKSLEFVCLDIALVETAGKFSMLRPCMPSKFFKQNMGNSGNLGRNTFKDRNEASAISIKTENISLHHSLDHFVFTRYFLKYVSYEITVS